MFLYRILFFSGVLATALFAASTAQASNQNAQVRIIHGINGGDLGAPTDLNVDVFVNGALAIDNFKFKTVAGPLSLPAGTYEVAIKLDLDEVNQDSDPTVIGPANLTFRRRENATVIAHLDAAGAPTASKFTNDVSRLGSSFTRLVLHHTAAAPGVDVYAGRSFFWLRLLRNFQNGHQAEFVLPRGHYSLAVTPTRTFNAVLGPAPFDLRGRTTYLVYVVGSINNDRNSLDAIVVPVQS